MLKSHHVQGKEIASGGLIFRTIAGGIGGAIGGKGLKPDWESARKGVTRELRRANVKYGTKQIAKYSAEMGAIRSAVITEIGGYTGGVLTNTDVRYGLGY